MGKKVVITISIILLFLVCVVCVVFFLNTRKENNIGIQTNNMISINDSVTKKYTKNEIDNLFLNMTKQRFNFEQIKAQFDIECIRETYQGYYIVLLRDDDAKVFVFFNEDLEVSNYCIIDNVLSKNDFDFVEVNITSKEQIIEYDNNVLMLSPFSSDYSTKHIIKEGVIVFNYNENNNLVESIYLITQEQLLNENHYSNSYIPYIIPKDIS